MKVYIKQFDYTHNNHKDITSFSVSQDEFEGFLMSKKGKKVLKAIIPPNSSVNINHPSILSLIRLLHSMWSAPLSNGLERNFYIYDSDLKGNKTPTKVFLEKYLQHQVSITFKEK